MFKLPKPPRGTDSPNRCHVLFLIRLIACEVHQMAGSRILWDHELGSLGRG